MVSVRLAAAARLLLAPNPSPMTLTGTNTYLFGDRDLVVVDPGPDLAEHRRAICDEGRVRLIVLTHGHEDHAGGARALADLTGAPVRALDPRHQWGAEGLVDGDRIDADGTTLEVVATPGHTSDSVSLVASAEQAIVAGDTLLGAGSTLVAHPDGDLREYLASLDRLDRLATERDLRVVYPGHGPVGAQPGGLISQYRAHRRSRLEQVRAARERGAITAAEIVAAVYSDVDPVLWPAAETSVAAQLEYLARAERAKREGP